MCDRRRGLLLLVLGAAALPSPARAETPAAAPRWRPWIEEVTPPAAAAPTPAPAPAAAPAREAPPAGPAPAAAPRRPARRPAPAAAPAPSGPPAATAPAPAPAAAAPAPAATAPPPVASPPVAAAPRPAAATPAPAAPRPAASAPAPAAPRPTAATTPPPPPVPMLAPPPPDLPMVAPAACPAAAPAVVHLVVTVNGPPGTTAAVTGSAAGRPGMAPVMVAGAVPPGALTQAPPAAVSGQAPAGGAAAAPAKPAPPPYSLPWQLRPAAPGTVARLDTTLASDRDAEGRPGQTQVGNLLLSYKLTPNLAPVLRAGMVRNVPATGASATVFLNPVAGVVYGGSPRPDLRAAAFVGAAVPLGSGAGNDASAEAKAALRTGGGARSAMDGAMFAVNDVGLLAGGDLAWLGGGATVQVEATLIQLLRTRGAAAQPDARRTNLTSGLHAGYFLLPQLSVGGELRYQRWLSTPAAVAADASGASRDTLTVAAGARLHARVGQSWVRPGISLTRAADDPLSARHPNMLQLDLPVAF